MAEPNPLIRPPRLLIQNPEPEPAPIPNPNPRFQIDRNLGFEDRGKIPQIVRDLPDFSGNPRDLSSWMLDVEDVLELFSDLRDTFQYHLLIKTIRRKIKGEANDALITSNTPTQWENIKEVLKLYYADKRDLMTLDNQLKSLSRNKIESIESYYSRVRELVTLISSAISMDDQWRGNEVILMKLYNQIALDTFIRGLGDPLSRFCKNFRPQSLAQAYSYCVDYLNLDARNAPVNIAAWHPVPSAAPRQHSAQPVFNKNTTEKPPVPPRQHMVQNIPPRMQPQAPPRHYHQQNFAPRMQPNSFAPNRNFAPQAQPNVFAPNRTFVQAQPSPEPMDTSTIRTHNVNYGNRPVAQRRGASDSMRVHDPHSKRMAHTVEGTLNPAEYQQWYDEQMQLSQEFFDDEQNLEPLQDLSVNDAEAEAQTEPEDKETNFLEDTEWVAKWFE